MVNNAAIYSGTPLLETTLAQWEQVMSVNLTGMFHGCKRAIQQMLTQEPRNEVRGRLINLGSQQGIVTCAARYALRSEQGRSHLPHQADRRGLCAGPDRLQLHLAGQDRHGATGRSRRIRHAWRMPGGARPGRAWVVRRTSPTPPCSWPAIGPPTSRVPIWSSTAAGSRARCLTVSDWVSSKACRDREAGRTGPAPSRTGSSHPG